MGEWGKVQQKLGRRIAYREHYEDKISDNFLQPLYKEMTKSTKVPCSTGTQKLLFLLGEKDEEDTAFSITTFVII